MLHILTSDAILTRPDFPEVSESLLQTLGPRGTLHLRSRTLPGHTYTSLARRLATISRTSGASLIVNRRTDIALAAGAHGVQLGRGALPASDVRRVAPTLQIGVSVHSVEDTRLAGSHPDWLIAGHIYPTATHPDAHGHGLTFLHAVVDAAQVPVVAVGGITPEHVASILRVGAVGIAVISGVWDEHDPNEAAIRYLSEYGNWAR